MKKSFVIVARSAGAGMECRFVAHEWENEEHLREHFARNDEPLGLKLEKIVELTPELRALFDMLQAHKHAVDLRRKFAEEFDYDDETVFDYVVSMIEVHEDPVPEMTDVEGLERLLQYMRQYDG